MNLAAERVTDVSQGAQNERSFGHSRRWVLAFALLLIVFSVAQKAYRLSLPTDGWSSTSTFESDDPVLEKNLLEVPSALRTGDRIIAVNGVAFTDLMWGAIRGEPTPLTSYRAGQRVRYTVVRNGEKRDLDVPLYAGSSLGPGTIFRQFFVGNGMRDLFTLLPFLLGVFVFWKRPRLLTAQLLFLQIAVMPLASGISWTVSPLSVADTLTPFTFYTAAFFTHWIHLLLEQPLGLHIILSFPKPSPVLRSRWSLPLLYGFPLLVLTLSLTVFPELSPFFVVALYNLLGLIAAIRLFLTVKDPVETAQVRWFVFGFAVANLGLVLFGLSVTGLIPEAVGDVLKQIPFQYAYLLCLVIALLRYRLFDIDVILNRALVWGGLSALVIGLYALVVGTLGHVVGGRLDLGASLLATGLIAVLFQPLRTFLQHRVNRLLYGKRDEPYTVLAELSQRSGAASLPASGLLATAETVARALKLPYVAVALPSETTPVAAYGLKPNETVTLPLTFGTEHVGELCLGLRSNEQRFSAAECRLLEAIAQQTSAVAYAALLTQGLQHSRERLVTTREEERRRLRRDLHDGLGPVLAGMTLRLDAARNVVRRDPERAEDLLSDLKSQTQDALADIRRLVYALRPPALDELGLTGALRTLAEGLEPGLRVSLHLPETLPPITAASEVALYRIAQEGLSNIVQHAHASRAEIVLCAGERLDLVVSDDGIGLGAQRTGVGLHSMRERAEELGGRFSLESNHEGTRLSVSLPLDAHSAEEVSSEVSHV